MKFGPVPVQQAVGAVLAHSLDLPGGKLRKGRVLTTADVAGMAAAGLSHVTVAQLEAADLDENTAAARLAEALLQGETGLAADAAFTGRVNLRASGPGVLQVDADAVARINQVDPTITLATLPPWQRVTAGMMIATVKIIPYAVEADAVAKACADAKSALRLRRPVLTHAGLVVTTLPGHRSDDKGIAATRARLQALDVSLDQVTVVAHDADELARALAEQECNLSLVLTASATSDRDDVGPMGLVRAGGTLTRFGMPVDPGNLLFLGALSDRPVIGLPGCARSPALNGADWVLERVICGVPPTAADIAAMGVGGLLKEIPTRPQPRERRKS